MNTLRRAVQEYLTMRRSLGFKLRKAGKLLPSFVKFLGEHHASYITTELALTWAQQPSNVQPTEWAKRLSIVRLFARHRSATDPRTQIPPHGLLPYRPKRAQPYLYSTKEILALLRAAISLPARGGLRPWTYHGLFGLLTVTGMRIGEACNLELRDVDLRRGVLTIRSGKFGKSRLIPIHASTRRVLADYLARRKRWWATRPVSPYLFVSGRGTQLHDRRVRQTFCLLSRQIGLRGPSDSHGPRIHDLRHRFAAMTLLRWYRSGKDVEQKLPYLSAYLGHVRVGDTFWYLSAWPELMREAMSRLERRWEGQS
jgi:integrase/recombinase XerD